MKVLRRLFGLETGIRCDTRDRGEISLPRLGAAVFPRPTHNLAMRFLSLLCVLCLPCAAQSNYWVDPLVGLDQAAGNSPSTPLRTITRALELAVPGTNVFLYPGEYGAASGETLPLNVGAGVSIRSLEGADATTLRKDVVGQYPGYIELSSGSSLVGVTVASPYGTSLAPPPQTVQPRARVSQCRFIGGAQAILGGQLDVDSCHFEGQFTGAVIFTRSSSFVDCEFKGTPSAYGIYASGSSGVELEVSRCKFRGCGHGSIRLESYLPTHDSYDLVLRDSLIVDSGRDGVQFDINGTSSSLSYNVVIEGTTIAGSERHGVSTSFQSAPPGLTLRSSIVANSGLSDFRGLGSIDYSLIGDGTGSQGIGNIAGDPGFVDAAAQDWSLRFDSPCLDRGEPTLVRADLLGHVRAVDSDLDLSPRADIGAIEHLPLRGPSTATVGQPFELGVTGPPGGFSTIIVAPGGYAPTGSNTIFGRLFLQPQASFRVMPTPTTGGGPTYVDLAAILDPAWIGTNIAFQALPRSFVAPAGGAFSNPLLVAVD